MTLLSSLQLFRVASYEILWSYPQEHGACSAVLATVAEGLTHVFEACAVLFQEGERGGKHAGGLLED